jgi:hypothetical protein
MPKSMIEEYELNKNNIALRTEKKGILILPVKTSRTGCREKLEVTQFLSNVLLCL